jgi:hypothetical protein
LYAQISVNNSGHIFLLGGTMKIYPYINNAPTFEPSANNFGNLGMSGRQFFEIRGLSHFSNQTLLTSDKNLKENFRKIEDPLKKILLLDGQKYDYKWDESDTIGSKRDQQKKADLKKNRLGFIAQEVKEILPESVVFEEESGLYYLDYNSFIPVIVEAMKEQQVKIERLESEVLKLNEQKGNDKSATIDNNPNAKESPAASLATLSQNIPNPFSNNTTIGMSIPSEVSKAVLYIYNMQGVQISSYEIAQRGTTSITIEGYTLQAGMYLYALIADGKEVDTKKMILTK